MESERRMMSFADLERAGKLLVERVKIEDTLRHTDSFFGLSYHIQYRHPHHVDSMLDGALSRCSNQMVSILRDDILRQLHNNEVSLKDLGVTVEEGE